MNLFEDLKCWFNIKIKQINKRKQGSDRASWLEEPYSVLWLAVVNWQVCCYWLVVNWTVKSKPSPKLWVHFIYCCSGKSFVYRCSLYSNVKFENDVWSWHLKCRKPVLPSWNFSQCLAIVDTRNTLTYFSITAAVLVPNLKKYFPLLFGLLQGVVVSISLCN